MPVLTLNAASRRRRPVACDAVRATVTKSLANIPSMLRAGDPNGAFPSGDVAGAVAFAYPQGVQSVQMGCSWLCRLLRSRPHVLAGHHLIDAVPGAVVGLQPAHSSTTLTSFVPSNRPRLEWTRPHRGGRLSFAVWSLQIDRGVCAPVKQRL